jgi:hypothetical protein
MRHFFVVTLTGAIVAFPIVPTKTIAGGIAKSGQSSSNLPFSLKDVTVDNDPGDEDTSKKNDKKSGKTSSSKPSEEAARRLNRQSATRSDRGSSPFGPTFSTGPRSVGGGRAK